jgi:hypothetical protein
MENECWKVLSVNRAGTYYSVCYNLKSKVKYPRSRWVFPKIENTPLFVFKDLESALLFASVFDQPGYHIVIYRAKYEKIFSDSAIMLRSCYLTDNNIRFFWEHPREHYSAMVLQGTLLVTGVRLVEKVYDKDCTR